MIITMLFAMSLPLGFAIALSLERRRVKCDAFQVRTFRCVRIETTLDDDDFWDDDVCLYHWRTDCSCFDEPVAPTYVDDPYEIVLPFHSRIEPPDWVDSWVAPQVKWVVKPKVNK
jgi:hypothetical protein